MCIEFNFEKEEYKLFDIEKIDIWIKNVIGKEKKQVGELVYNFVSKQEILKVNIDFLNHDYYTDIITFDESFVNIINGTIFISPDIVKYNSEILQVNSLKELHRVIIHGIMHLCGYPDHSETEKVAMRKLEDKYLAYLEKL